MTKILFSVVLLTVMTGSASGQESRALAVGATAHGYSFGDGYGAKSALLVMTPVALTMPVNRQLTLDLYSAFARGSVKLGDVTYNMQGVVDTRIRASYAATPWAVLSASVNLPTGNATHSTEEAIVANGLSTEILGFREALWGTGFGFTTGVATASRIGDMGVGIGASYRVAGEFEPSTEQSLKYSPGNETRLRVALDRNIGGNKLTAGVTFQNYSEDKVDGHNLFAPGNRWRGDVTYSFRASATSAWTVFVANVRRENGDVTLRIVDGSGNQVDDSTFQAGHQNMLVAGFAGGMRVGSLHVRPSADFRLVTRESGADEGWLTTVGTDFPMRRGNMDVIPNLRVSFGQLEGQSSDDMSTALGGELGLTLRWGRAR